ncbi:MAG: arylsulfatase [Bacteroidetes bacterium]|nr:arylsulfatase [Bacteroidota bacterium]
MKYSTNFHFFLMMTAVILSACNHSPMEQETSKPNVIFIMADDLGYGDLSCYGQTKFSTPNIDKLAKNGMLFTQHYSGATVCAPSRSALLTGMHTGHTPIRGNKEILPEGQHPLPDSIFTMAEMFQGAGYVTGAFGKWGLGFPGSDGTPNNQGFNEFYGYNCQRLAHNYYPYYLWDNGTVDSLPGNKGRNKEVYSPQRIHEHAIDFLEHNKDTSFFMFYPTAIPHAELVAPEAYMEKYRDKYLPENSYEGLDEGEDYRNGPYESQKESHAAFVAMIDLLDVQVGEIIAKVEKLGISDNTIIVFTSDNGPHQEGGEDPNYFNSNGPLRGFKRDLYEGGIRVPLIIIWPGKIQKASRTDQISAFWDFMPTFAEFLDQPAYYPRFNDGISIAPTLLSQSNQEKHEYLYWEFHERGGRQAIRKNNWKAVRYNVFTDKNSTPELYDLSIDPGEENNLAESNPDLAKEMSELMLLSRTESQVFNFESVTYLNVK